MPSWRILQYLWINILRKKKDKLRKKKKKKKKKKKRKKNDWIKKKKPPQKTKKKNNFTNLMHIKILNGGILSTKLNATSNSLFKSKIKFFFFFYRKRYRVFFFFYLLPFSFFYWRWGVINAFLLYPKTKKNLNILIFLKKISALTTKKTKKLK